MTGESWEERGERERVLKIFEQVRADLPIPQREYYHSLWHYAKRFIGHAAPTILPSGDPDEGVELRGDELRVRDAWIIAADRYLWKVLVSETFVEESGERWLTDLKVERVERVGRAREERR